MGFNQLDVAAAKELLGVPNINKNKKTKQYLEAARIELASHLKGIRTNIEQNDLIQACNRYVWYNLPDGLNGQLVERMLYYRGQLMLFYNKIENKFYILPYTLSSPDEDVAIDCYGRLTGVKPIMFNGALTQTQEKAFNGKYYKPYYDVMISTDEKDYKEAIEEGCVLLKDRTSLISETTIPRCQLSKEFINMEAEAMPMARTSLMANSGIKAIKVPDTGDSSEVEAANDEVEQAAITGRPFIPIVSNINTEELTAKGTAQQPEGYFAYMQVLDNLRLATLGLDTGGIFQKSSQYQNIAQTEGNMPNTSLMYHDGLVQRQRFCNIVNSIYGLGIWCDEPEMLSLLDENGNGKLSNNEEEPEEVDSDENTI